MPFRIRSSPAGYPIRPPITTEEYGDGTVTDAKLSDAYTDIKQRFAAHLAETVITANKTINVPGDFATIQAALDSLKKAWIPRDVTVTIQVASGAFNHTSPIIVDHPCGSRIKIIGATPITTSITGNGTVTGSAGNWSVPILVQSTSGIAAGGYVIIRDTAGTGDHYAFRGIWKVISVDSATQITVQNTHRAGTFPTATLSGGTVVALKTILEFTSSTGLIVRPGTTLGFIDNIALVGDGSNNNGIDIGVDDATGTRGYAAIKAGSNFGVNGFGGNGIFAVSAGFIFGPVYSCGNGGYGVLGRLPGVVIGTGVFSGNGASGVLANLGLIVANKSTACGNKYSGFATEAGGRVDCNTCIATGNGDKGFFSSNGGFIYAANTTAFGNTNSDYGAYNGSTIFALGYVGSPTFSPALNTVGNGNSIIVA